MKPEATSDRNNYKIASAFLLIVALSACASTPSMGTPKVSMLTDAVRTDHKGDFQGLYEAWIRPQLVNAPGSGNKWGKIDVTDVGDQKASEKTITEGFAAFCSDMGGKSEVQPLKYGHKDVCTDAVGGYLGDFTTERFDSGLAVKFDSKEYRAQQQRMFQAEMEAQNKRDYQNLASPSLTIAQLQNLISRYQNNDPDNLIPQAKSRLTELVAQHKREVDRAISEKMRRLENKQIGDQICHFDTDATMNVSTNVRVFGVLQYRSVSGITKIAGFVEDINGMKIKIRISGITFRAYGGNETAVDSFSNYKGGSNLQVNSMIWDDNHAWEGC